MEGEEQQNTWKRRNNFIAHSANHWENTGKSLIINAVLDDGSTQTSKCRNCSKVRLTWGSTKKPSQCDKQDNSNL